MKTICVLLICFLAVVLADRAQEDAEEAKEIAECKKELGIAETSDPSLWMDGVSEDKKSCMYFCLFKKHEMMNENGTINKKEFLYLIRESKRELAEKAIEKCEKKTEPVDGCKIAACLISAVETKPELKED